MCLRRSEFYYFIPSAMICLSSYIFLEHFIRSACYFPCSQYAIYSTRIRGTTGDGISYQCVIRSRDDQVEPIDSIVRTTDTIGGDPSIYYLFSPGKELASPIKYEY